jgi:two-component system copper resistance phosphate regulon response regulator CusR
MRILLVEGEPDVAQMLAKGLREQSYAVDVAADGEAASNQAQINDYDLIILNMMLPENPSGKLPAYSQTSFSSLS